MTTRVIMSGLMSTGKVRRGWLGRKAALADVVAVPAPLG